MEYHFSKTTVELITTKIYVKRMRINYLLLLLLLLLLLEDEDAMYTQLLKQPAYNRPEKPDKC